jgi:ubiquinone/menaquinone biosynthesis C-methylase UbiE
MKLFQRFIFNLWYFRKPPWDSGITPPELFDFIQTHPAGHAIDLGCGTGTNVITLAKTGWQVTGVDFAARAIRIAKRKIKNAGVDANLYVDDVTELKNIGGQFDLVLDIGCFHGVTDKPAYLHQIERILAPKGFWLVYGFFKTESAPSSPGFTSADLDMISARGLTLISRKDGFDKRERSSAWMLYQRK